MPHKKFELSAEESIPECHNSFFKSPPTDHFVEISSCKSFSKSNEKKLKLIKDRTSLEKSSEFLQQKRKIKPLNLKVAYVKEEERTKKALCSIKGFKEKINKITNESNFNSNIKNTTLNSTDISESIESSTQKINDQSNLSSQFRILLNNQVIVSNQTIDPFPTLGNSLVVHESSFNPDSLLQSKQATLQSNQVSFENSPRNSKIEQTENNFITPSCKMRIEDEEMSTRVSFKKEKITLNNARKVETNETLKTENEGCYSIAEENEYKRFFDNLAFPDYFSTKEYRNASHEKEAKIHKFFNHDTNHIHLY